MASSWAGVPVVVVGQMDVVPCRVWARLAMRTDWLAKRGSTSKPRLPIASPTRAVVAMDLRGRGWSEITPRGYRKTSLALDVLAVLRRLGLGGPRYALDAACSSALRLNTPFHESSAAKMSGSRRV